MENNQTDSDLAAPKTSGLAIASLITGLTCLSPVAIVCGHIALSRIKASAGKLTGGGLALAGTILGYVGLLVIIFGFVPMVFVGARAWKDGSDRAGCLIQQRNVASVISQHRANNQLSPGDAIDVEAVLNAGGIAPSSLVCPAGGDIIVSDVIKEEGESCTECPNGHELGDLSAGS